MRGDVCIGLALSAVILPRRGGWREDGASVLVITCLPAMKVLEVDEPAPAGDALVEATQPTGWLWALLSISSKVIGGDSLDASRSYCCLLRFCHGRSPHSDLVLLLMFEHEAVIHLNSSGGGGDHYKETRYEK